jgi:hypothetical protein
MTEGTLEIAVELFHWVEISCHIRNATCTGETYNTVASSLVFCVVEPPGPKRGGPVQTLPTEAPLIGLELLGNLKQCVQTRVASRVKFAAAKAIRLGVVDIQFLTVRFSELTAFFPVIPSNPAKTPR